MTAAELASGLRQRLLDRNLVTEETLRGVSDWAIIESYVTCSGCGEVWHDGDELEAMIACANTAEEFVQSIGTHSH